MSKERRRRRERDAATDAAFRDLRTRVETLEKRVLSLQHKVIDLSNGPIRILR